jgi:hypothetical protein
MSESLLLKWGTLKGWHLTTEKSKAAFNRYAETGVEYNAMRQDTSDQKHLLCDLIDAIDGEIQNDWTGDMMTKDEAKEYVMNYRKAPA